MLFHHEPTFSVRGTDKHVNLEKSQKSSLIIVLTTLRMNLKTLIQIKILFLVIFLMMYKFLLIMKKNTRFRTLLVSKTCQRSFMFTLYKRHWPIFWNHNNQEKNFVILLLTIEKEALPLLFTKTAASNSCFWYFSISKYLNFFHDRCFFSNL